MTQHRSTSPSPDLEARRATPPASELKARHRAMWASGDYPSMVETFLLPLGPRLVEACGIGPGMRVLDVAAGTGNASIPAAQRGARRHRQRPHARAARGRPPPRRGRGPRARLGRGRRRAAAVRGRVVRRRDVLDRRDVRAPPSGGRRRARPRLPPRRHDRPAELDARGHDRRAVPHDGPVRPAAPARRAAAAAVGQRGARARAVRRPRRASARSSATSLEVTAFEHPHDYGEHFKARYGPTIAARANARKQRPRGRVRRRARPRSATSGTAARDDRARFEMEYLLAVGTRV